jgi:probable rRNA maturation factor
MQLNIEINIEHKEWNSCFKNIRKQFKSLCEIVLKEAGFIEYAKTVELSVLLTSDYKIKEINKKYRSKDKPTNVLSFPGEKFEVGQYADLGDYIMLGDLAFALEVIVAEAKDQDKKITDHFYHLVTHGLLHLLGYDHVNDNDAKIMENLEVKILSNLGIANPY